MSVQILSPIKCGKCKCEYFPRHTIESPSRGITETKVDFSCPQCGFGESNKDIEEKISNSSVKLLLG